ncbi:MASE1 domain-containing protein [Nonomuraea jabiensis]|uniref:Integral membrane sensor domain MASE1 n=1 Tax=Nonomuraea jabiensis TaxID=882448 RepID=A0A7W9GCJ1_9ACTN|nr:MASE1 domain-containing protein [Nonomuraea jabiensis]MBB5781262.1 integral membrane sensor domain MASE1 [Nonomuraea jabiensis]
MRAVAVHHGLRDHAMTVVKILAVAIAYFVAAKLGLQQQLVRGQVTPLWPSTGIGLAALLLLGLRIWPGITLGAFLVNVSIGPTMAAVLGISMGNTLAPVCAYLLLERVGFRIELDRLRDALALVFLGAFAGMLVSATAGAGSLVLAGGLRPSDFWSTWSVWWTGDAMGVLVVTPLLLASRTTRMPRAAHPLRWVEGAALLLGTFLVTLAATVGPINLLFLVFPFLIWSALRFQLLGAAACALIASTVAIVSAAHHFGPFAQHDLLLNMVALQAFNGSAALTALLLAAIIAERDKAHRNIKDVCARLNEVAHRLAGDKKLVIRLPPPRAGERSRDRSP